MPISLTESQSVNKIAELLYDFLPGKPHPYADQSVSFPGIAQKLGLSYLWRNGSKLPSLTTLLEGTLDTHRSLFCDLILEIVRSGMKYRNSKGNPITFDEIQTLNELIAKVNFKIPELWSSDFLESLPRTESEKEAHQSETLNEELVHELKGKFIGLADLAPQTRGYAFEKFLRDFFSVFHLEPRSPFRILGEQIDGSFQLEGSTYLVEAKWHNAQTAQADLLVFHGKIEGKAKWSRGLFVSFNGFTPDGLDAFSRGRSTSMVGMTGQDIFFILDGMMTLDEALTKKSRRAAETGEFFVSVYELSNES